MFGLTDCTMQEINTWINRKYSGWGGEKMVVNLAKCGKIFFRN